MHKIRAMRWHLTSLALLVVVAIGLLMTGTSGTMAAKEAGADGLMREGLQAYQRGAFDKALASWKQAAQGYEQQEKPMEQSRALVAAAQASEAMGQVTQALQQLEVALALAQKSQDKVWTATVQSSLGHAYLAGRQPDAAMSHLTQAMETAPQGATPVIAPLINFAPTCKPAGAIIYAFSPSLYWSNARRAVRIGSYSMPSTVASTPCF